MIGLAIISALAMAFCIVLASKVTAWVISKKGALAKSHPLWVTSPFEEKWFDETTVTVERSGLDFVSLVGINLTNNEIIRLSGAPGGSSIVAKQKTANDWLQEGTGVDKPPPGLYFYVAGPLIDPRAGHTVGIVQLPDGRPGLYLKDVFFHENAPAGIAGRMLVRMVRTSIDLGIVELALLAAGGRTWPNIVGTERWGGYVAWPTYGFDMPLEQKTKAVFPHFVHYPHSLSTCYTVREVLALHGGPVFWKVVGDGWFMRFDCANENTPAVSALLSRVRDKGV